jgi:ribosome-binding protein aMBF1 (putative translation factor)
MSSYTTKKTYQIQEKKHLEDSDRVRKAEQNAEDGDFHVRKVDPSFIKRLVQYRLDRGWKQQDLARFLNLPQATIAGVESGRAIHDPKLMQKIKQKCGLF